MQCEVCGQEIWGKPHRTMIEGAMLYTCDECAKLGSRSWVSEPKLGSVPLRGRVTAPRRVFVQRRGRFDVSEDVELAENLAQVVRQARERAGLTHEELGKRINERVSVLQRVETGKFQPDNALARKLEHALGVKILVSASVPVVTDQPVVKQPPEPTLGDVVSIKKRKSGGSG